MSKTILVTGGAGFIGSHLCDRLLADGHHVRVLDIRHCFADVSLSRQALGFVPRVALDTGLNELGTWLAEGHLPNDHVEQARLELTRRGLAL